MQTTVNITKTAPVTPAAVWAAIRGIGGLDRWFPIIETCRVEGAGVGAIRIFVLAGAGEVRDRIIEIDDAARRFRYDRFASPFPVQSYIGTVDLRAAGGGTELSWTVVFDSSEEARDQVAALVHGAISDGVDGLFEELRGA